ncbi:hypothetical protein V5E97_09570 [Singulisphaera sp. Ch08]|uniref:Uncharacterized protein n=1 Tax=Singulisphaera sp. Ch08 TaxID=3120278 RepID=A0AAU7CLY5_9BACT
MTRERIESQLAELNAERSEIRDQLWAITGLQANADRLRALAAVDKQIDRMYFRMAELELASV